MTYMTKDGKSPKILEVINADNFHLLGDLEKARQSGDTDTMKISPTSSV